MRALTRRWRGRVARCAPVILALVAGCSRILDLKDVSYSEAPSCGDGQQNGDETDVDCGGSCAPCDPGRRCTISGGCVSSVCTGGVCQQASCSDQVKNGDETGADCGGSCGPCPDGEGCQVAVDCTSQVCSSDVCQVPSCSDRTKNGTETDVDCGGGACGPCPAGDVCQSDSDCATGTLCDGQKCRTVVGRFAQWCGKVNLHESPGGTWIVDPDCKQGCFDVGINGITAATVQQLRLSYCQLFFSATASIQQVSLSPKPTPLWFPEYCDPPAVVSDGTEEFACLAP